MDASIYKYLSGKYLLILIGGGNRLNRGPLAIWAWMPIFSR